MSKQPNILTNDKYTFLVLQAVCFLLGAMLSVMHLPMGELDFDYRVPCFSVFLILGLSSLLASSLFGLYILPVMSALFGCVSVLIIMKLIGDDGSRNFAVIILLLTSVPAQFCIGNRAMTLSSKLITAIKQSEMLSKREFTELIFLVVTPMVLTVLVAVMIICSKNS